jgi:hypothetical protein
VSQTKRQAKDSDQFSFTGLVAFLAVVALFLFVSTKAGTRASGVILLAGALRQQLVGRISYGWEGQPASGYITGWLATLLNALLALFGLAILVWPEVAMSIFGWK